MKAPPQDHGGTDNALVLGNSLAPLLRCVGEERVVTLIPMKGNLKLRRVTDDLAGPTHNETSRDGGFAEMRELAPVLAVLVRVPKTATIPALNTAEL